MGDGHEQDIGLALHPIQTLSSILLKNYELSLFKKKKKLISFSLKIKKSYPKVKIIKKMHN